MSNILKLGPIHFSRGKKFLGGFRPLRPPGYGPGCHHALYIFQKMFPPVLFLSFSAKILLTYPIWFFTRCESKSCRVFDNKRQYLMHFSHVFIARLQHYEAQLNNEPSPNEDRLALYL